MYANLEDLEARSMDGYGTGGIQPLWKADASGLNPVQIQPRSTSRTSIYSTTSSSDQEGTASSSVMLSTLEPVARRQTQQQSLPGEIEMISQMSNGNSRSGTKSENCNDQFSSN